MPAIVGVVQVISISSASVFHIGDVYRIAARSNAKTFAELDPLIQGTVHIQNYQSTTNTFDQDGVDQGNYLNV